MSLSDSMSHWEGWRVEVVLGWVERRVEAAVSAEVRVREVK